jgi:hypothetical protein
VKNQEVIFKSSLRILLVKKNKSGKEESMKHLMKEIKIMRTFKALTKFKKNNWKNN